MSEHTRYSRRLILRSLAAVPALLALGTACQPAAPAAESKPAAPAAAPAKPAEAAKPVEASKPAAAPASSAKPLAGQTVKALMIDHVYHQAVKEFVPEFEDLTGAKLELDLLGFQVANQRIELELSGATGAYDVTNNTFIWLGKWIGANWCTDLMPLINDPQLTDKTTLDLADFVEGAIKPFQRGDKLFALPWVAETTMLMYRKDIFEKNNIAKPPATFDEMVEISKKIHTNEVAANLTRGTNGLHWVWPNYLFPYGGGFFANAPDDMSPILNSPEAVKSAEVFAVLSRDYGVPGSVSFNDADAQTSFNQGKAAMFLDALGVLNASLNKEKSTVYDKVSFAVPPAGPAGKKPQIATHGLMIPAATKDKKKGWEYIKWATSKEMMSRIAFQKQNAAIPRTSVLTNPKFKETFQWGGADIGAIINEVIGLAGAGYMAYRTVPEFGPIADRTSIALAEIISNQKQPKAALDDLNKDVASILEKAGHKIRTG